MAGKLNKLRIFSYHDLDFKFAIGYFDAYFNPESYTVNQTIDYCNAEEYASTGSEQRFVRIPPKSFSLDLLLDGTGASGAKIPVQTKIAQFMATCYQYVGKLHRPPFLVISWGTMLEKCVLKSVSVSYTLFSPEGVPLRAKIKAGFESVSAKALLDAIARKNSPDLTHTRVVRKGDTLPLMCKDIYGDEAHYLKVAAVNKLVNYRQLQPGTELFFPPINEEI